MAYPSTLDVLVDPSGSALMSDVALLHSVVEKRQNDAIEAVQTTLGLSPQGGSLTVAARLAVLEGLANGALPASQKAAINGVASLDASSKLVQQVDATKVTSGTLDAARLPNHSAALLTSGLLDVARLPGLSAGVITSGTFPTARIPGLPGNWITSGTIDAARLPSAVTANANVTVVADLAGRDAIALADRADGKLVYQRSPAALWLWRADSAKWQMLAYRVVHNTASVIQTVTNAFANVTGFSFPVEAGLTYGIKGNLYVLNSGSSTPDIRFGWSFPAGRMHSAQMGADVNTVAPAYNGTWTGHAIMDATSSPSDDSTGLGTPAGVPLAAMLDATFECTTAGTVQLRFAQVTTAAQASILMRGSRLTVESL